MRPALVTTTPGKDGDGQEHDEQVDAREHAVQEQRVAFKFPDVLRDRGAGKVELQEVGAASIEVAVRCVHRTDGDDLRPPIVQKMKTDRATWTE